MDPRKVVHSDPELMGGTPVFVGTRVPVQSLFDYLEAGDSLDEVLAQIPPSAYPNEWLENRRGKLLLSVARQYERDGELHRALELYAGIRYPGARQRHIRVLELGGQTESEADQQLR